MNPTQKKRARFDFMLTLVFGMILGGGGGALGAALASHHIGKTSAIGIFILYVVTVIIVLVFVQRAILKKRAATIARLRAEGVLPDAATQSDSDVIRLANAEKRETAALLYWDIHGGQLDAARFIVGVDRQGKFLLCLVTAVLVLIIATMLYATIKNGLQNSVLNICVMTSLVVANAIIFSIRAKRAKENRKHLANGILPTPDSACLWRKS